MLSSERIWVGGKIFSSPFIYYCYLHHLSPLHLDFLKSSPLAISLSFTHCLSELIQIFWRDTITTFIIFVLSIIRKSVFKFPSHLMLRMLVINAITGEWSAIKGLDEIKKKRNSCFSLSKLVIKHYNLLAHNFSSFIQLRLTATSTSWEMYMNNMNNFLPFFTILIKSNKSNTSISTSKSYPVTIFDNRPFVTVCAVCPSHLLGSPH